ncbi:hypothetical protein GQ457_HM000690 [Hibiscus cannabinus]
MNAWLMGDGSTAADQQQNRADRQNCLKKKKKRVETEGTSTHLRSEVQTTDTGLLSCNKTKSRQGLWDYGEAALALRVNSFKRRDSETITSKPDNNNIVLEKTLSFKDLVQEKKGTRRFLVPRMGCVVVCISQCLTFIAGSGTHDFVFTKTRQLSLMRRLFKASESLQELPDSKKPCRLCRGGGGSYGGSFTLGKSQNKSSKGGKGFAKDEKAQKLALQHWLEAIDPRHRYGHNLHLYYDVWFSSESSQPFFYWLAVGDGKEVNLEKMSEKKTTTAMHHVSWTKRKGSHNSALYVGPKGQKGKFQHSSFLAGVPPPQPEDWLPVMEFSRLYGRTVVIISLRKRISWNSLAFSRKSCESHNVKRCAIDDDHPYGKLRLTNPNGTITPMVGNKGPHTVFKSPRRLPCKWTTGVGPRIGCRARLPHMICSQEHVEQVNLSPRVTPGFPVWSNSFTKAESKDPSSPKIAGMGLPSPRPIPAAN